MNITEIIYGILLNRVHQYNVMLNYYALETNPETSRFNPPLTEQEQIKQTGHLEGFKDCLTGIIKTFPTTLCPKQDELLDMLEDEK